MLSPNSTSPGARTSPNRLAASPASSPLPTWRGYEQTRTLTLRFNHLLAALERELEDKIDFATWARALTAAKKKIPQWGESS